MIKISKVLKNNNKEKVIQFFLFFLDSFNYFLKITRKIRKIF